MSTPGHRWIGIAFGLITAYISLLYGGNGVTVFVTGLAAFWGSTAPDWMEIAKAVRRRRHLFGLFAKDTWDRQSVIPHRTITHWMLLWIGVFVYAAWTLQENPQWLHGILFGFSFGCLGHLICDIPNPTGVPLLTPFARSRRSLRMWKSGDRREWSLVLVAWVVATGLWFFHPHF